MAYAEVTAEKKNLEKSSVELSDNAATQLVNHRQVVQETRNLEHQLKDLQFDVPKYIKILS